MNQSELRRCISTTQKTKLFPPTGRRLVPLKLMRPPIVIVCLLMSYYRSVTWLTFYFPSLIKSSTETIRSPVLLTLSRRVRLVLSFPSSVRRSNTLGFHLRFFFLFFPLFPVFPPWNVNQSALCCRPRSKSLRRHWLKWQRQVWMATFFWQMEMMQHLFIEAPPWVHTHTVIHSLTRGRLFTSAFWQSCVRWKGEGDEPQKFFPSLWGHETENQKTPQWLVRSFIHPVRPGVHSESGVS